MVAVGCTLYGGVHDQDSFRKHCECMVKNIQNQYMHFRKIETPYLLFTQLDGWMVLGSKGCLIVGLRHGDFGVGRCRTTKENGRWSHMERGGS